MRWKKGRKAKLSLSVDPSTEDLELKIRKNESEAMTVTEKRNPRYRVYIWIYREEPMRVCEAQSVLN